MLIEGFSTFSASTHLMAHQHEALTSPLKISRVSYQSLPLLDMKKKLRHTICARCLDQHPR